MTGFVLRTWRSGAPHVGHAVAQDESLFVMEDD